MEKNDKKEEKERAQRMSGADFEKLVEEVGNFNVFLPFNI